MKRYLIVAGLTCWIVLGGIGSYVPDGPPRYVLWAIGAIGATTGYLLLAVRAARRSEDEIAVGFVIAALAEAIMASAFAEGESAFQTTFAGGTGLYVPALLLISIPRGFAIWARAAGILGSVFFAVTSALIYSGYSQPVTSSLPSIAFTGVLIAMIGWIIAVMREKEKATIEVQANVLG